MGAGNGLFPGNAGLDFAVKVADLTGDLGQAGCGMVFVAGKRLGLEPVQQARKICVQGHPCDLHLYEITQVLRHWRAWFQIDSHPHLRHHARVYHIGPGPRALRLGKPAGLQRSHADQRTAGHKSHLERRLIRSARLIRDARNRAFGQPASSSRNSVAPYPNRAARPSLRQCTSRWSSKISIPMVCFVIFLLS